MQLHYMGKYSLDPDSLPHGEHKQNAVPFKEPKDTKTLSLIANLSCIGIIVILAIPAVLFYGNRLFSWQLCIGCLLSLLTLFPHEILHAVCFRKDVYLYSNLKQGMIFVVGTEDMSKSRFIIMSLLPNLVFGIIPYIVGMIFPQFVFLIALGILATGMGAGDYLNVFNSLTQMPKGARTYLYKFNSFWYIP